MDINFRILLIGSTMVLLSALIIKGLVFSNSYSSDEEVSDSRTLKSTLQSNPGSPVTQVKVAAPVTDEDRAVGEGNLPVMQVVQTKVTDFKPEFDEAWCKVNCPGYKGQKITLSTDDLVIMDLKGVRITDYNEMVLKSSPVSNEKHESVSRHDFKDAYIHVKGFGPMKVKAVAFNFETLAAN